ncbi:cobyric acid synthase [Parvibium lacunae]|uniref:Cobyric acid synthase n=2 Tax=Parvibium lacunae TaxID=1888893 RepID=A0A368L683_9BURK|nr:cobyric acid synthase [Parvibium lacunae]
MIWGTASGAGKSWLTTALCRWAARQGARVAPYKAQNMSNNARVVSAPHGWGEIGSAQYFQALAARVTPTVAMNPVLLKPENERGSQVIVAGQVRHDLSAMPWRERSALLAKEAAQHWQTLAAQYNCIILEGAGSPAEINLAANDYVNLHSVRWAQQTGTCRSVLVTDIDRGGAFAHLYGTWALLPEDVRSTLSGFVLNKFRGDPSLLAPGPQDLAKLTGIETSAVIPMQAMHGLPEEDGPYGLNQLMIAGEARYRIGIVAYPTLSNLDEFTMLQCHPAIQVIWLRDGVSAATQQRLLAELDAVILPGSKQVSGDLAWLKQQGWADWLQAYVRTGKPLLGICGGLQMLGETLDDAAGYDGQVSAQAGLGLLPLATRYGPNKVVQQRTFQLGELLAPWQGLSELRFEGYEIHCGETVATAIEKHTAQPVLYGAGEVTSPVLAWQSTQWPNVLGIYAHGLLEAPHCLQALLAGPSHSRYSGSIPLPAYDLQAVFEQLADCIEEAIGPATLREWLAL